MGLAKRMLHHVKTTRHTRTCVVVNAVAGSSTPPMTLVYTTNTTASIDTMALHTDNGWRV